MQAASLPPGRGLRFRVPDARGRRGDRQIRSALPTLNPPLTLQNAFRVGLVATWVDGASPRFSMDDMGYGDLGAAGMPPPEEAKLE